MTLEIPHTVAGFAVTVLESCASTNDTVRALARAGAPAGTVVIAAHQTAGRGRLGRRFFSPPDTGLYMSILLRPDNPAADSVRLTAVTAVGVAAALEQVLGCRAGIKWVNDILIDGKKVCGILTEGTLCGDRLSDAVVGIGINLDTPRGGFPAELAAVAGAAAPGRGDVRAAVAQAVLRSLSQVYAAPDAPQWLAAYRARSVLDGARVRLTGAHAPYTATAVGVDEAYRLKVRLDDGTLVALSSGEVSAHFFDEKDGHCVHGAL